MAPYSATAEQPSKSFLFLRKFMKHGTRVASVSPSSKALAKAMCAHIDPEQPQTIVELGAGTGAITRIAAAKMHPESRLISVEIDPQFCEVMRKDVPAAEVLCADVRHLAEKLQECELENVDLMLSGLPMPSMPASVNVPALEIYRQFAPEAIYSQLTVMPWIYQNFYRRLFEDVQFDLVMKNIPPGGVYHCRGLKDDYRNHLPKQEK